MNSSPLKYKIWWHGTNATAAEKIAIEGFLPNTYFAEHLEDALECGGPSSFHTPTDVVHIFEVAFPADWTSESGWQMRIEEPIPASKVLRHYVLTITSVSSNPELHQRL